MDGVLWPHYCECGRALCTLSVSSIDCMNSSANMDVRCFDKFTVSYQDCVSLFNVCPLC